VQHFANCPVEFCTFAQKNCSAWIQHYDGGYIYHTGNTKRSVTYSGRLVVLVSAADHASPAGFWVHLLTQLQVKFNLFTADPVKTLHFDWSNLPFLIFDIRALCRSGLNPANSSNLEQLALNGLNQT